jgi:hypothetical protein
MISGADWQAAVRRSPDGDSDQAWSIMNELPDLLDPVGRVEPLGGGAWNVFLSNNAPDENSVASQLRMRLSQIDAEWNSHLQIGEISKT